MLRIFLITVFSIFSYGKVWCGILQSDSTTQREFLGSTVNSVYDEQDPVLAPDLYTLYFTRKNHPQNSAGMRDPGDIWYSMLSENNTWTEAKRLEGPVNDGNYNAIIGFTDNGNTMYLQNHYNANGKPAKTQGISVSRRRGNSWSYPEKVSIDYYYNKSKNPSMRISADGKIMLMSIESYNTQGGEDIYVSFLKSGGNWSQPVNLGPVINTRFQEMTPYLSSDNRTLYFASNGHGGYGSRDIFMSERLDNTWKNWSEPKNLGANINTKGVELSYHITGGDYAYFVSTMDSEGFGDLRRIKIEKPVEQPDNLVDLEEVEDLDSIADAQMEPLEADIQATEVETPENSASTVNFQGKVLDALDLNKPIPAELVYQPISGEGEIIRVNTNDVNGSYNIELNEGISYLLTVSAEGYMSTEERVMAAHTNVPSIQKHYLLTPIKVGTTVNLENVLFERGTANLLSDSFEELKSIIRMMNENPGVEIELAGHTDNQGSGRLNLQLSQERVDKVKAYLVEQGISENRITGKGYGGTRPIASNASESTRKLNRRVEFTILKN